MIQRTALAALGCLLTATLLAAAADPQLQELDEVVVSAKVTVPLEDFVEFPKYDSVVLSPSGKRVAMAWIDNNFQRQMAILEVPSLKPVTSYTLAGTDSLSEVRWANERRLLLQVHWPQRAFLRLRAPLGVITVNDLNGGNPYRMNFEGVSNPTGPMDMLRREDEAWATAVGKVTKFDDGKWPGRSALGPVRMIDARSDKPDVLLFQTLRNSDRKGGRDGYGAFELNLKNNSQTRVATLPVAGGLFVTGPGNRIAVVSGINAKNESEVYYLPADMRAEGRNWKLSVSTPGNRGLRVVGWTGKGEEYFALDGRGGQTTAVVAWNATDNTQRVLHRNAAADIENVMLDPDGRPWMFSGSDHFPVYWYPDPAHPLARLHRMLVQKVPRELIEVMNASDDMTTAVIRVSSGRRPPVFMIVNVTTGNSMTGMFTYPTLRQTRLSQVDPIEFLSRDGLTLRGYLTTPEDGNGKPRRNLPLLVIAHDGPLGAPVESAYEYERQVFASRGYAVLQVNRRGSPGRGAAFQRAGDGKWGRETQDDYIDAVRWAIRDGVADRERICFYGSGYGAYSAMTAAAHEPNMFKCVIGVAGVYDLPLLLGDGKKEIPPALQQVLGADMAELKARSPVNLAASIKTRVLLVPQQKDEVAPAEQSNRMRNALRDAGNTAQSQMIGQEYDGLHIPATRANGYDLIFRFLEQRIGR